MRSALAQLYPKPQRRESERSRNGGRGRTPWKRTPSLLPSTGGHMRAHACAIKTPPASFPPSLAPRPSANNKVAITVVRRRNAAIIDHEIFSGGDGGQGRWARNLEMRRRRVLAPPMAFAAPRLSRSCLLLPRSKKTMCVSRESASCHACVCDPSRRSNRCTVGNYRKLSALAFHHQAHRQSQLTMVQNCSL